VPDSHWRYPCAACGGQHGLMEICPEKPGFLELLAAWGAGERNAMTWLAFGGLLVFVFLIALAILVLASA